MRSPARPPPRGAATGPRRSASNVLDDRAVLAGRVGIRIRQPGRARAGGGSGCPRLSTSAARSPCSAIRPWSNTITSSTMSSVDRRWAMTNVVRPFISSPTASAMRRSVSGSTRAVASSRTTRSGSRSHTRARASSWACPADSPAPPAPSGRSIPASTSASSPACRSACSTSASVGPRVEQRDVVADRPLEQLDLLGHEGDTAAQLGERDVGDRHPAEGDAAVGRLDESEQQPRERRLAAAGAPDDPDRTTAGDRHVDVVEDRLDPSS